MSSGRILCYTISKERRKEISYMKFVIQRVSEASVTIDGAMKGQIGKGFVVLIGVGHEDNQAIADKFIKKLLNMRIFLLQ